MSKIKVNKFLLDSGERYCVIINKETGIPLFHPNLYLTTQVRNSGHAIATIESKAVNLSLFYRFMEKKNIDIEEYILSEKYLSGRDIDHLIIFLSKTSDLKKGMRHKSDYVSKRTLCNRLDNITAYLSWLTEELLQYDFPKYKTHLSKMLKTINARKPICNYYNDSECAGDGDKALSDSAVDIIMKSIDPHSPDNPFESIVRNRNAIIIMVLTELGIRGGELLNIKIEDINFQEQMLYIRRRADEVNDPRLNQPLVKTLGRALALSNELSSKLMDYIIYDRKLFAKGKSDFLFITYKSGPFQGEPLSKSGYFKILSTISKCDLLLKGLTGHKFRHTWNYNFSCLMDSLNVSEKDQGVIREKVMGWRPNSGTAEKYNKRFVKEKANDASVRLQERLSRRNRGVQNDK